MGILMPNIILCDLIASKSNKVIAPTEICDGVNISWRTTKPLQLFEYFGFVASLFGSYVLFSHGATAIDSSTSGSW